MAATTERLNAAAGTRHRRVPAAATPGSTPGAAGQTTTYLRGLLVAAGLLPEEDQALVDFERWLRRRLTTLEDHPYQQVLRQFGLWHQLPRMRAKATRRRLPTGAGLYARHQFKGAQSFLTWLVGTGRSLATLGKADLERWFTTARRSDRDRCRGFLAWAMTTGHMPIGRLPALTGTVGPGMTQTERLGLLRNCAMDNSSPIAARVAAVLVLLFAQPLTRIRVLTLDDIIVGDDDLAIRLGDPPSPVPQPFATLLLELCANRENLPCQQTRPAGGSSRDGARASRLAIQRCGSG